MCALPSAYHAGVQGPGNHSYPMLDYLAPDPTRTWAGEQVKRFGIYSAPPKETRSTLFACLQLPAKKVINGNNAQPLFLTLHLSCECAPTAYRPS